MSEFFHQNFGSATDGLFFGLGILAVYLGAILSGSIIRSLSGAGSTGITFVGRYVRGWWDYLRGDDRTVINVTLNMIVDGHLKFDTLVADRRVWFVWPNAYRVYLIRRAAKRTTAENPVVLFPKTRPVPRSYVGKIGRWCGDSMDAMLATTRVVENGKKQRVRLIREDDYKATYGPLISLVSEKCSNDNAIDLALGRAMDEHRFVIALTFEKLHNRRARHLRALVMWEEALHNLPDTCPQVEIEDHRTRFKTLQAVARQYAASPECFGVVKIWRHKGPTAVSRPSVDDIVRLGTAAE